MRPTSSWTESTVGVRFRLPQVLGSGEPEGSIEETVSFVRVASDEPARQVQQLRRAGDWTGGALGKFPEEGHQVTDGGGRCCRQLVCTSGAVRCRGEPRGKAGPPAPPLAGQIPVCEQPSRIVPRRRQLDQSVYAPPLDGSYLGRNQRPIPEQVVQELLEVVDQQVLVGKEALRRQLVLAPELRHGGVEVPTSPARSRRAESRSRSRR